MKWCVQFPEETILIVRPSLVAICMGNRPAAKLLNALLYRYSIRKEHKEEAENINKNKQARGQTPDQDTTYAIHRSQSQLVEDMCGEMTEKTLHDVAIPALQLLGYLDVEEDMKANRYILHVDKVTEALNQYNPDEGFSSRLEKFLISSLRLEKFLISSEEKIDRKNFQSRLEKVLIWNRKSSNYHRGRKTNAQAASEGKSKTPRLIRDIREKESNKENDSSTPSSTPSSLIANQTTQKNVESLTTGNTLFEALEPEQKRIADYLEKLEFEFDDTDLNRGYLSKIEKKVHSLEEMASLLAFTRMQEHLKGKTVFLGNLANTNNLNGWKQEQAPPPHKPKSSQQGKPKSLAELNAEKMQYAGITARK